VGGVCTGDSNFGVQNYISFKNNHTSVIFHLFHFSFLAKKRYCISSQYWICSEFVGIIIQIPEYIHFTSPCHLKLTNFQDRLLNEIYDSVWYIYTPKINLDLHLRDCVSRIHAVKLVTRWKHKAGSAVCMQWELFHSCW
jgi:hypothetical protein